MIYIEPLRVNNLLLIEFTLDGINTRRTIQQIVAELIIEQIECLAG